MHKIVAAQYLATVHHGHQVRKESKLPYIIHPTRIAISVTRYYDNYKTILSSSLEDLISAAYLHDTLEDTDINEDDIKSNCGDGVLQLVKELTSDKEEIKKCGNKGEYLAKKMNDMSRDALFLKLLDRLDNITDARDTKNNSENSMKFALRYKIETLYILDRLDVNVYFDIRKLIRDVCDSII